MSLVQILILHHHLRSELTAEIYWGSFREKGHLKSNGRSENQFLELTLYILLPFFQLNQKMLFKVVVAI